MAQPKTKRPTGLTVKRSDENFTFTWKIGDADYQDGQTMQVYHQYAKKWVNVASVGWGTTKKTVVIPLNRYYPNTKTKLTTVQARVRGNRKKYWVEDTKTKKTTAYDPTVSDWSTVEFAVLKPSAPSIKATVSTAVMASCTFEWTHPFAKDVHPWITDIQWQSQLVKECATANGAELSWASNKALDFREGTTSSSSSITIDENTELLADDSYTRWVRVRSRGPAGFSDWKYARHVYARPYQAKLISADVVNSSDGGYMCKVVWRANAGHAHPIDQTTVQYVITNPVDGVQCPDGLSWTDAFVARDTSDIDAATFSVGNTVDNDQCMFVRVNTTHDKNTTNGKPVMVAAGYLSDPDGLTVNMPETRRASISANNNALPNNPDSFLAVVYITSSDSEGFVIGVIPHGATSTTVQAPDAVEGETSIFGVYAVVGSYKQITRADGITAYSIDAKLRSKGVVKQGGDVPLAPSNVSLSMTETPGTIRVTFDWDWRKATAAELSWADHADAWESTAKPSTFVIDNTHANTWNISGLATGKTWYVRVRLTSGSGDGKTYGAYSDIASIDLSSAPAVPVLSLSSGVITEEGTVTASWSYASGDGTAQANAEVAEVTTEGGTTAYTPVATTHTATNVAINAETVGWLSGEIHTLVVRVVSDSGRESAWSDPVSVAVADPITAEITDTSLVEQSETDEETQDVRTFLSLTEMPLSVTVLGAGEGGTTSVIVERSETYHVDRPDETEFHGFEGETIAIYTQTGEAPITFDLEDLLGSLDDEASYRIIATVQDGLGQSAEVIQEFEVHWTHQASMPMATAEIIDRHMIAVITPTAENAEEGDVCDIYRLSVDKPELIYPNAEFGLSYVDPYPAIGPFGGHRVVFKTANGDYITADNRLAWVDLTEADGDTIDSDYTVIDFDRGRILINRNLDIENAWKKDFKETQYLGGSIQGDWNPAVSREAKVATVAVSILDQETIQAMRRLAVHAGICHIRTSDGSSYAANIDVSDSYSHDTGRMVIEYDLSITRIESEDYDGMTYAEWKEANSPPSEENVLGTGEVDYMILTS